MVWMYTHSSVGGSGAQELRDSNAGNSTQVDRNDTLSFSGFRVDVPFRSNAFLEDSANDEALTAGFTLNGTAVAADDSVEFNYTLVTEDTATGLWYRIDIISFDGNSNKAFNVSKGWDPATRTWTDTAYAGQLLRVMDTTDITNAANNVKGVTIVLTDPALNDFARGDGSLTLEPENDDATGMTVAEMVADSSDGWVRGTAGGDIINTSYTDPFDQDRVDNNDAILPGRFGNDDNIDAGAGDDDVEAGLGNDLVYGGSGLDTLYGGVGNDTLYGEDDNDRLIGGEGNDSLFAGMGDDYAIGYEGNDHIEGGDGNDSLYGDFSGGTGNDTIYGGAGNDQIELDGGEDSAYGGADNDRIFGYEGNDTLHGDAGDDYVGGDEGDDVLYGGDGNDSLAGDWDDELPPGGNDSLFGGIGNDTLRGEHGNDTLYGGDDNDTLFGGADNDSLSGDAGNDRLEGGAGTDALDGGTGNDSLDGGADNDTLTGGGGDDTLTGGQGNDLFIVSGGAGDRILITDFGFGETDGNNDVSSDNDYVDLTQWYNDSTLAQYNLLNGTSFTYPLMALRHDAENGVLDFIAYLGGPHVEFSGAPPGDALMDAEHTGVTCFARGTRIETLNGPVAVEALQTGDLVETMDHGWQPIRWIGARKFSAATLAAAPQLQPIRISAGALGQGLPLRDLIVSPQHRVLISSKIAERMFGSRAVLIAAKQLLQIPGIDVASDLTEVEYFHFLLDQHQLVFSEGAPTESLFTGAEALKSVSPEAREEIFRIFPDLMQTDADSLPVPARPIPKGRQARKMAHRHAQNQVELLERL